MLYLVQRTGAIRNLNFHLTISWIVTYTNLQTNDKNLLKTFLDNAEREELYKVCMCLMLLLHARLNQFPWYPRKYYSVWW